MNDKAAPTVSRPTDTDVGSEVALSINDFGLHYGRKHVLDQVGLEVHSRKITALIGPSGSGKSSILRTVNRMTDFNEGVRTEGQIMFNGQNILSKDVDLLYLRKRIGLVFQKPTAFPLSIYDNVAFGPRLHGVKKRSQLDEIVESSLIKAALWNEVKDRLSDNGLDLSGGQQQRLCISRALAVDPEILLMDEPCSALDPIATQKIEDLMTEIKKTVTILIVTHNMQQAGRVSDFTAFLYSPEEGKPANIIEFDRTGKIFTNPANKKTEDYISGRFG